MVAAVLAHQAGAFEALVARYQRLVFRLIERMVRQPEDSLDLSQETFLRVHQRLGQFRFESSLASWIGRVAFNIAARYLQRKRLPLIDDSDDDHPALWEELPAEEDTERTAADAEIKARLDEAIADLPAVPRTVLSLYHLEELGVAEIAQICQMPVGTVKNTLFRARIKLRQALKRSMEPRV